MAEAQEAESSRQATFRDPEHLNEAIRLTSRSTWVLLSGMLLCVIGVVIWSILGRLDFHASGGGVLLPKQSEVANVVARASGTITDIRVATGQRVKAGDVLVNVKLDEIQQRRDQAAIELKAQQAELERYNTSAQADIERRRADLDQELKSLQLSLGEFTKSREMLDSLYNNYVSEVQRGLATREQLQATYDRLNSARQSIRQMNDKMASEKTAQIEFENQVARNLSDLRMRVIDAQGKLSDLDVQFRDGSTIRSPVAGVVTEVTAQLNQQVTPGTKLLVVQSDTRAASMVVHAYLRIDEGKRVRPGMPAEVSPSSIDERIYGSIRGQVTSVSALPMSREGLEAVLGNSSLVADMMKAGPPIEVLIALNSNPNTADGLAWTSGISPPTRVTSGVTATSRIVVDSVSPFSLIVPIAETWTHLR